MNRRTASDSPEPKDKEELKKETIPISRRKTSTNMTKYERTSAIIVKKMKETFGPHGGEFRIKRMIRGTDEKY